MIDPNGYSALIKKVLNRIRDLETRLEIEDEKPLILSYQHFSRTWLLNEIDSANELYLKIAKRYAKTIFNNRNCNKKVLN